MVFLKGSAPAGAECENRKPKIKIIIVFFGGNYGKRFKCRF